MKKISIVLLVYVFALLSFSCASNNLLKVTIEMPGISLIKTEPFNEFLVTSFLIEKETKEFNLSKEIVDSFMEELGRYYKGNIGSKEISLSDKELFKDANFWKALLPESNSTLFLAGTAEYTRETRKAILEKVSRRYDDLALARKRLAERKFYTLIMNLYLINGQTGEVLYERNFKETRGYDNPNQTSYFAFYDLIQQAQTKFFRNVFGLAKIQQRFLISN